jgi:phosphate-selective porin
LGVSAAGELFDKKLSYLAMVGNGNGGNSSANDNDKFQKSLRLVFTPVATAKDRVAIGANGLWSDDAGLSKPDLGLPGNLITGSRALGGLDAQWTHGPLELSTEWLRGTFHPTNATPASSFTAEGAHVTAAYFLIPAKLQAMVREEWFDPNTAISGNTMRTLTLGLNYYLKGDDIKFMLNYLIGDVPNTAAEGDRLLTRIQVIF